MVGATKGGSGRGERKYPRRHAVSKMEVPSNKTLRELNEFLDNLVVGHREQMEAVVNWLWKSGNLEREIHDSVASIGSIFQKWSFEILFLLRVRGTMRFNQLKEELGSVGSGIGNKVKELAGVGSRTLSSRLKDLEKEGIIERKVYPEVPVRIEYSLTERGERFGDLIMPVIAHLRLTERRPE